MNQKGGIGVLLAIVLLLVGIFITVYLSQSPQVFKPKASEIDSSFLSQKIKAVELYDQHYESWDQEDTYKIYANQLEEAYQLGFNTVRIWYPWHQPDSVDNALNSKAIKHLKLFIEKAKQNNMYVLLPLTYCSKSICGQPSGEDSEPIYRTVNPMLHNRELEYVKQLASALRNYDNLNYEFFGENSIDTHYLRNPNYPKYQQSFSNYWRERNGDLSFLNFRWGTSFDSWDEVQPPPAGNPDMSHIPDSDYRSDFYEWWAFLIRDNIGELAREIRPLINPASKIGYEDNGIINGDFLPQFNHSQNTLPIPQVNPYDYIGHGNYPTSGDEAVNLNRRFTTIRKYYPGMPVFISEMGVTGDLNKQDQFIPSLINQLDGKYFGFTIWMLKDYPVINNAGEANFGILNLNSDPKPIVQTLIQDGVLKAPAVSPTVEVKIGDIDKDGDVDIFDFNFLVQDYRGANMRSDLNGDSKVDLFDFNLLITNFGR